MVLFVRRFIAACMKITCSVNVEVGRFVSNISHGLQTRTSCLDFIRITESFSHVHLEWAFIDILSGKQHLHLELIRKRKQSVCAPSAAELQ